MSQIFQDATTKYTVAFFDENRARAQRLMGSLQDIGQFQILGIADTISAAKRTIDSERPSVIMVSTTLPNNGAIAVMRYALQAYTPCIYILDIDGVRMVESDLYEKLKIETVTLQELMATANSSMPLS